MPEQELALERRHALVTEIRDLEKCVTRLNRRVGFLVGLVSANVAARIVEWMA